MNNPLLILLLDLREYKSEARFIFENQAEVSKRQKWIIHEKLTVSISVILPQSKT
jgi:hypothetical protein